MKSLKFSPFFFKTLLVTLFAAFIFNACQKDDSTTYSVEPTFTNIGKLEISAKDAIATQDLTIKAFYYNDVKAPISATAITLHLIDAFGISKEIGDLYDDGQLDHFDEIKGDGVFSGSFVIHPEFEGKYTFVASRKTSTSGGNGIQNRLAKTTITVYADIKNTDLDALVTTQHSCGDKYESILNGNTANASTALTQTLNWLKTQPAVATAKTSGNAILITYKSGLHGGFLPSFLDENGNETTLGGGPVEHDSFPARARGIRIPIERQVRGTLNETAVPVFDRDNDIDKNSIGNRNVLIYMPFEQAVHDGSRAVVEKMLKEDAQCGKYSITTYLNQEATVGVVETFAQYGTVFMLTHGSGGEEFATGEIYDPSSDTWKFSHKALEQAGKIAIWTNMVISNNGFVEEEKDIYAIRAPFISDLEHDFPNSLILNCSCQGTMTSALENAFIGKGAQTYLGFSQNVSVKFAAEVAEDVFKTIAVDGKTVGEIPLLNKTDPYGSAQAIFELKSNNKLMYGTTLANGSFEFGLNGWSKEGDGRNISQLGSLSPLTGSRMGIISTGLGFTTSSGSLFQSFTVPGDKSTLHLQWNFLSEEFLEYIGSQFQDQFQVVIVDDSGAEHILFSKTIDEMAADFSATKDLQGQLLAMSPGIVFDQGDVSMTDFKDSDFDISDFKGKCVTLILRCTDVGDSIYDTAVLIDNISLN
jgi:hypothetical protein